MDPELILMLLVANLANTKWCKKPENLLKPLHMSTHLRALSESFPLNTNMTRIKWFSESLCPCALDISSLSIGRVKNYTWGLILSPANNIIRAPFLSSVHIRLIVEAKRRVICPDRLLTSVVAKGHVVQCQSRKARSTCRRRTSGACICLQQPFIDARGSWLMWQALCVPPAKHRYYPAY